LQNQPIKIQMKPSCLNQQKREYITLSQQPKAVQGTTA
jgi:hypothetical protein